MMMCQVLIGCDQLQFLNHVTIQEFLLIQSPSRGLGGALIVR